MRQLGYKPAFFQKPGEFSMVRPLTKNDYPRFHLYITHINSEISFKLHLDQKKPSYKGITGHSGEYEGPVIEEEVRRIKDIMLNE